MIYVISGAPRFVSVPSAIIKEAAVNIFSKLASASVFAISAGLLSATIVPVDFPGAAFAASEDAGSGGQGNQGGQGQGSQGSQSGQSNQGGEGAGQGGPDSSSDSKGPQAGTPSGTGSGGGKPIWAQEGIPEVELGRLSVARSPDQVLERSLLEAIATLTPDMAAFYNLSLDQIIAELSLNWDNITIYDSPLQNLALFEDVLMDGSIQLPGVSDADDAKLLAVFLGVASDKALPISEDTVIAIVAILSDGEPTIAIDTAAIAAAAEAVRIAVLAGHG
jgi:hypothetical protein